jgi:S-adenosylmethionine decarboxylase|tara:strand:- start:473 stop:853 length:381 start_codon:yes stop_codon:yes gene_type:complete
MNGDVGRGLHFFLDYSNYTSPVKNDGEWMLNKLRDSVKNAGIREVHSHVERFDGTKSPPGYAAVVLIDESHVTAHCYSEIGLLAIDVFTCGDNDPQIIVDDLKDFISKSINGIKLVREEKINRFVK